MYHVGQKVRFDGDTIGYIVEIKIDPIEEYQVGNDLVVYVIRFFADHLYNGYFDFCRTEGDFEVID